MFFKWQHLHHPAVSVGAFVASMMLVVASVSHLKNRKHASQLHAVQISHADVPLTPFLSDSSADKLTKDLQVIFVLDPNFHLCWEHIPVDDITRATILPWVGGLTDILAETLEYLQVKHSLLLIPTHDQCLSAQPLQHTFSKTQKQCSSQTGITGHQSLRPFHTTASKT